MSPSGLEAGEWKPFPLSWPRWMDFPALREYLRDCFRLLLVIGLAEETPDFVPQLSPCQTQETVVKWIEAQGAFPSGQEEGEWKPFPRHHPSIP